MFVSFPNEKGCYCKEPLGAIATECLLVFPKKKLDKGDRAGLEANWKMVPAESRPGKQLTDGERLNRTPDHPATPLIHKYNTNTPQHKYKYI